ncbi:unnamed protein product, partial [Vitis vinifera]
MKKLFLVVVVAESGMDDPVPTSSSLPLEGRVAIVTGASRGIGRAIAIHLRSLGARLVLNYASNSALADALASQLNSPDSSSSHPVAIAVQANYPSLANTTAANRLVDACPMGRLGEPKDVTQLVGFLATDAGEWINGQIIRINGGFAV